MAMAEEEEETNEEKEEKKKGGILPLIFNFLFIAVAVSAGFFTPVLLSSCATDETGEKQTKVIPREDIEIEYIEFGKVTANLDEPNLTRYLKVNLSLEVAKEDKTEVAKLVTEKKNLLQDWLNSFLASQSMSSIRGRAGHNRLRREIRDHFNTTLFLDGVERVQGVLFLEFNVQ